MVRFVNCEAFDNLEDGFVTNNPDTSFEGCRAYRNGGAGFRDNSGFQNAAPLDKPSTAKKAARFLVGVAQGALGGAAGNIIS